MADPTEPLLAELESLEQNVQSAEGDDAIVTALTGLLDFATTAVARAEAADDYATAQRLAKLSEEACLVAAGRVSDRLAQSMVVASTYWGMVADFTTTRPTPRGQPSPVTLAMAERSAAEVYEERTVHPQRSAGVRNPLHTPSKPSGRGRTRSREEQLPPRVHVKERSGGSSLGPQARRGGSNSKDGS